MTIELSIVIPMYNEEDNLEHLFSRLFEVLYPLKITHEIICVNDGSRDKTLSQLIDFHKINPRIKIINLSRNFGKEIALSAGIDYAQGQAVVPIDADLQDPPELIHDLIDKWREGYDIVYATRRSRQGETWMKQFTAKMFYKIIGRMAEIEIPSNTGDFRLMDRKVVNAIKQLPERTRFMKGLFAWVGYRQTFVLFDREPRFQGQTKWNYWKLWNFALGGIFSFSLLPLKVWTYLGSVISLLSLAYAIFLILKTLILGIDVAGYTSLMVAILFLGGVQLISLGVIGEYLGRVYEEVKARRLYLVSDLWGLQYTELK